MRKTLLDCEYGHLEMEYWDGEPLIHLTLNKWSKEKYKKYKTLWQVFLNQFRELGYKRVLVAIPDNDPKLEKFEKMFGFTEIKREKGVLIMERKT